MTVAPDMIARAREMTAGWSDDAKAEFARKVRAQARRLRTINECPDPARLAARFDVSYVQTPAVRLVAEKLVETARTRDGRLIISAPPQELKSTLARAFIAWLLADDPERRILFASYAAGLARTSGRIVRGLVETHGDAIGLSLDRSHFDASDWQLDGHRGGLLSVGVGGSLTGRPGDVLLIDDPLRNQQDADSPVVRGRVHEWWEAVARTRLAPGAPVIVIQTRWHEDDLAGRLETQGWPVLNIPAMADGDTADALGREPGTYLTSTRGRTPEDWDAIRKDVGERTWAALYQGRPAPLTGGVFKSGWFDTWRLDEAPAGCLPPVVVVDPADNEGDGDEAGIIVAAKHLESGRVLILDDLSAAMTVGRWARLALLTCVRREAPTLVFEKSLSQLPTRIREAWQTLHRQATALRKCDGDVAAAVERLARPDDGQDARSELAQQVAEIVTEVDGIVGFGPTGPAVKPIQARGSKQVRMQLVAPMFETGRAVMVGRHPQLEHVASVWQPGQDSPDRVDAMVHACGYLGGLSTGSMGKASGGDRVPTSSTGARRASRSGARIGTRSRR